MELSKSDKEAIAIAWHYASGEADRIMDAKVEAMRDLIVIDDLVKALKATNERKS
jgi:hypothetical protein